MPKEIQSQHVIFLLKGLVYVLSVLSGLFVSIIVYIAREFKHSHTELRKDHDELSDKFNKLSGHHEVNHK